MSKSIVEEFFDFCFNVFGEVPDTSDIKQWLFDKTLVKSKNDYLQAFTGLITLLGARVYNNFLDYGLLALKLCKITENQSGEFAYNKKGEHISMQITDCLLHDDRHDLYQNLPFIVRRGSTKDIEQDIFNALISSINLNGDGDTIYKKSL